GNQKDLAGVLRERFSGFQIGRVPSLLYAAGEDRAGDLAGELARAGIAVRTAVVYRAVAVDAFSPAVRDALALGELDGVLHFSRRTAEALAQATKASARASALLDTARKL